MFTNIIDFDVLIFHQVELFLFQGQSICHYVQHSNLNYKVLLVMVEVEYESKCPILNIDLKSHELCCGDSVKIHKHPNLNNPNSNNRNISNSNNQNIPNSNDRNIPNLNYRNISNCNSLSMVYIKRKAEN